MVLDRCLVNVSLCLLLGCLTASFSLTSWRASIQAPFLAAPESESGLKFFHLQEIYHGKEAVLWQSEL